MSFKTKALVALWLVGYLLLVAPWLALTVAALITVLMLFTPSPRPQKLLPYVDLEPEPEPEFQCEYCGKIEACHCEEADQDIRRECGAL